MKTRNLLFTLVGLLLSLLFATAQETVPPLQYDMTFKGRGEATSVQSVYVENLSRGTNLTISGTDVLRLTNTSASGIETVEAKIVQSVLYPNPSNSQSLLTFPNRADGNVTISIYDFTGKLITSGVFRLQTGKHTATLPAMPTGNYIVSIRGAGIHESLRWICTGKGSTGSIQMSGLENNLNTDKPTHAPKISTPRPQYTPASPAANIVEMKYEEGELLRFTGTNGKMKTIVMNIPTLSHDITFDFFKCEDANGYNYKIVNVGGILWMAEDLRNVPNTIMPIRDTKAKWTNYPANQPKQAYYEFNQNNYTLGGYFNFTGAKAALPKGWDLPTADEINYMVNKIGGYAHAANKLKARGTAWAQQQNAPDTTSFGAISMGYLDISGVFSGQEFSIKYWTRSTKTTNKKYPFIWGIENDVILLKSDITGTLDEGYGLRVRGCRPAPSAYAGFINSFGTIPSNAPMQRAGAMVQEAESTPLGAAYTISDTKKKLFADFSYRPNNNQINNDSRNFYRFDYSNYIYTAKKMPYENGLGVSSYLKKATSIRNSKNRENLVVATWNRPTRFWNSSTTTNPEDFIYGAGKVSLITYNDGANGYERIDSITLPTDFLMDNYTIAQNDREILPNNYWITFSPFDIYLNTLSDYLSRFQIFAADFDGDGKDELVITLDRMVVVYKHNGSKWEELYSKTFTFHDYGTALSRNQTQDYGTNEKKYYPYKSRVRVAVGDADGDNTPDIVAVYMSEPNLYKVDVYSAGKINQQAKASGTFVNVNNSSGKGKSGDYSVNPAAPYVIEDIKIGNVAGHKINTIAVMAARRMNAPTVALFEYNNTYELKKLTTYSEGKIQQQGSSYTGFISGVAELPQFNDNLTLVDFDGYGKLSIVAGNNVLTYNDGGSGVGSISKITDDLLTSNKIFVLPDFITAANYNGNDMRKEQLAIMWMNVDNTDNIFISTNCTGRINTGIYITTFAEGKRAEKNITPNSLPQQMGVRFNTKLDYPKVYFDKSGTKWETMSTPFLAHARSDEGSRTLRYIEGSHSVSMSEPRIHALLAAPPFWKYKNNGEELDYGSATSMGTTWGSESTTGSSHQNETSNRTGAIIGFEYEWTTPIWPIKLGGIELTTHLEWEWTHSRERQFEVTQGIEWTAPNNDAVILSAVFYDTYMYEIIASENPDEIGGKIMISIPKSSINQNARRMLGLNLEDYNRIVADNPECPDLREVFKHKVGYPFTYPNDTAQVKSNVQPVSSFWEGIENMIYRPTQPMSKTLFSTGKDGSIFVSTGSGNDVTRSIQMTESSTVETGMNFNVDVELVATLAAGHLKLGGSYGHTKGSSSSHSVGTGHCVAGCVPSPVNLGDAPAFNWTLAWYKYRVGNQEFPVVNYVVKP